MVDSLSCHLVVLIATTQGLTFVYTQVLTTMLLRHQQGQGASSGRVKHPACIFSSDCLWRHSRPILRLAGTLQGWWRIAVH